LIATLYLSGIALIYIFVVSDNLHFLKSWYGMFIAMTIKKYLFFADA
jgi:hypothetical protein